MNAGHLRPNRHPNSNRPLQPTLFGSESVEPEFASWIQPKLMDQFGKLETTAHRIGTHPRGGWVERFGDDCLVSYPSDGVRDDLLEGLDTWLEPLDWKPGRVFTRFLPRQNEERISPQLFRGDATLPPTGIAWENGFKYGVDFGTGYSVGLFVDQRENRSFLRSLGIKRLLNTFAYTCAFSVVAAKHGAETVSLDLSKKSVERGRENFVLNGIDPAPHSFFADDVLEALPRLYRRGELFDGIILDPPTFSRGNKGRRWQVEKDFADLYMAALDVAAPGAKILLSTNCTRITVRDLERIIRLGLKTNRRSGELAHTPRPEDFPYGSGATTLWILLKD
jgi:23S rRNA (cytosine1962-C5)-methyltransferase